jgi:hypothetical protein
MAVSAVGSQAAICANRIAPKRHMIDRQCAVWKLAYNHCSGIADLPICVQIKLK